MTNPRCVRQHINDIPNLYEDIKTGNLPAVSIVKPSGIRRSSGVFEARICLKASPRRSSTKSRPIHDLWASTAIFVTFDEGGGYYDSGYIQPR